MKQLIKNYTFDSAAKTVTLTDLTTIRLDRLLLIVDVTKNQILYNFSDGTLGATVATNVITLTNASMTGLANGDKLAIFYDVMFGDAGVSGAPDPIAPSNLEVDQSVTSAVTIFTQDCVSPVPYRWVTLQLLATVAWSGVTVQFEISNDNATWFAYPLARLDGTTGAVSSSESTSGRIWAGAIQARYFRVRVSGYTSGTVRAIAEFSTVPAFVMSPSLGAAQAGNWSVTLVPAASGGPTVNRVKAAASTNSTNLKGSAGQIYGWALYNNTAAAKFVKLYNKAAAPTVGTDTPAFTIILPANGQSVQAFDNGIPLGTGIGYGITGAVGDADATNVAVDDVHGLILTK